MISIRAKAVLSTLAVAGLATYASAFTLAQQTFQPATVAVPAQATSADVFQSISTTAPGDISPTPAGTARRYVTQPSFVTFNQSWGTTDPTSQASRDLIAKESAIAQQADSLARQLESADTDTKRSEAKTKLSEALGKQFDVRQERHQKELEALETKVKKLKELIDKRKENRSEIISRRLDQIVRDAQGLGF